jgi:hypothetical protein
MKNIVSLFTAQVLMICIGLSQGSSEKSMVKTFSQVYASEANIVCRWSSRNGTGIQYQLDFGNIVFSSYDGEAKKKCTNYDYRFSELDLKTMRNSSAGAWLELFPKYEMDKIKNGCDKETWFEKNRSKIALIGIANGEIGIKAKAGEKVGKYDMNKGEIVLSMRLYADGGGLVTAQQDGKTLVKEMVYWPVQYGKFPAEQYRVRTTIFIPNVK